MPTTGSIQKRSRKSIGPIRPQTLPLTSATQTKTSSNQTVCHLCGYLGRTQLLSIEKHGYSFLRHLPPAPGALPMHDDTKNVRACYLCGLILDKQRELNETTTNFFFKGFFRSVGSCHMNNEIPTMIISNKTNEKEHIPNKDCSDHSRSSPAIPQIFTSKTNTISRQTSKVLPPPLRKTEASITNSSCDKSILDEMSSLDSFVTSIRSRFLSEYSALQSSIKSKSYDSCHLCLSIKPNGTLYTISKTQFDFLSSSEIDVCTLCYYNLMDQYKKDIRIYRRPRAQCYLCHCHLNFIDWEIKLLETEHLPFLLKLYNDTNYHEHLYDNKRLALSCDQCFYTLLFQYIDQERLNIPINQRTYSWQCTSSNENERFHNNNEVFYV